MIKNSIVAIVTPMHSNGDIDYAAFEKLLHMHKNEGTSAVVVLGTTGEAPTITDDEKKKLIALSVKIIDKKMPVIVGTGTNATQLSIEYTRMAKSLGADACMTVVPYYNKPTQEGLFQHFTAIAESVDLPQIMYNHPGRCVIDMTPETVARLCVHKNIIGIKEGPSNPLRCKALRAACGKDFAIYSGDDIGALDFMLAGADGHISVAANLVPTLMHDFCLAAISQDYYTAKILSLQLAPLFHILGAESNPIPIKWALHIKGWIKEGIRLPLTPLHIKYREMLEQTVEYIEQWSCVDDKKE